MRVFLITGGAGFIGSSFAQHLLQKSYDDVAKIYLLDSFKNSPYPASFKERRVQTMFGVNFAKDEPILHGIDAKVSIIRGCAGNFELVQRIVETYKITDILHAAAIPNVREVQRMSEDEIEEKDAEFSNCRVLENLLAAIEIASIKTTIALKTLTFLSSSTVYGQSLSGISSEDDQTKPVSFYGQQKERCEKFLSSWYQRSQSVEQVNILRPFSVYGPWCRPDMAPFLFTDRIYKREPLQVVQGDVQRDFTHIEDVVRAIGLSVGLEAHCQPFALLQNGSARRPLVWNIGASQPRRLGELIDEIATALSRAKSTLNISPTRLRKEEVVSTRANVLKAERELGWRPMVPFSQGIAGMVRWYVEHMAPIPYIVALVATKDRPGHLRDRSLESIERQNLAPACVLVVDDSEDEDNRLENQRIVERTACRAGGSWVYCRNLRSPGASGAWNTGILAAMDRVLKEGRWLESSFVAILDDDDRWEPTHLELCSSMAASTGAQQVVSGLVRIEKGVEKEIPAPSADSITPPSFYGTNPGIQGSNMFVSIASFLQAGMFAEHLPSTTDRDMMIRLACLPQSRHVIVHCEGKFTVRHYADETPRLTNNSPRKKEGLCKFLRDHGPHMNSASLEAFLYRAEKVFGIELREGQNFGASKIKSGDIVDSRYLDPDDHQNPSASTQSTKSNKTIPLPLIIGITSDQNDGVTIKPLLQDLARIQREATDPSLVIWVLVLENPVMSKDRYGQKNEIALESSNISGQGDAKKDAGSPEIPPDDQSLRKSAISTAKETGLLLDVVNFNDIKSSIDSGILPSDCAACMSASEGNRLSISESRTVLQRLLYAIAWPMQELSNEGLKPMVAVFDDDKSFHCLVSKRSSEETNATKSEEIWTGKNYFRGVLGISTRAFGADIILGVDSGAPPLPSIMGLRLQLVDAFSLLRTILKTHSQEPIEDSTKTCVQLMGYHGLVCHTAAGLPTNSKEGKDVYHDLSCYRTDHLEQPMCPVCLADHHEKTLSFTGDQNEPNELMRKINVLEHLLQGIIQGDTMTRKLHIRASEEEDWMQEGAFESCLRGGSTILLNIEALKLPNLAPSILGRKTRRSDMIWSLIHQRVSKFKILLAPNLAVLHRRGNGSSPANFIGRIASLCDDVYGHAVYQALKGLSDEVDAWPNRPFFSLFQKQQFLDGFYSSLGSRIIVLEASFARMYGILCSMKHMLEGKNNISRQDTNSLNALLMKLDKTFQVSEIWQSIASNKSCFRQHIQDDEVLSVLSLITNAMKQSWEPDLMKCNDFFNKFRTNAAFNITNLSRYNDAYVGKEGVTFVFESQNLSGSCNLSTLKVLDVFSIRAAPEKLDQLMQLSRNWTQNAESQNLGKNAACNYFCGLLKLEKYPGPAGSVPMIKRAFVPGIEYKGGHGDAMFALLKSCFDLNIVCNNICPQNLIVQEGLIGPEIKIIDYGLDIVQWTEVGYKCMAARAFLSWRFANERSKSNLKSLLARISDSLFINTDTSVSNFIPELEGFDVFYNSLITDAETAVTNYLKDLVSDIGRQQNASSLLDFGCGHGQLIHALEGFDDKSVYKYSSLSGYDPGSYTCNASDIQERWKSKLSSAQLHHMFITRDELIRNSEYILGYDVVVCTRVICTISNDEDVLLLLKDLHKVARSEGRVCIAVCNPLVVGRENTPLAKMCTASRMYPNASKVVRSHIKLHRTSRQQRVDFQRSIHTLRLLLLRAKLEVIETRFGPETVETHRFEPVAELVVFICRPLGKIQKRFAESFVPRSKSALLIKACTMDWRTLQSQVRHITSVLQVRDAFDTVALCLDCRLENFSREHSRGCPTIFLKRLAKEFMYRGLIDQVIDCMSPEKIDVDELYERWLKSPLGRIDTHALNGSPLYSTLKAFDTLANQNVELVLQVDCDIMVRSDALVPFGISPTLLETAFELFQNDKTAITWSLPIFCTKKGQYDSQDFFRSSYLNAKGEPHRVEVRGCFLHLPRLISKLPILSPCTTYDSWYRMLDRAIQDEKEQIRSYRMNRGGIQFIHPQNALKKSIGQNCLYSLLVDSVERAPMIPEYQSGKVDAFIPGDEINMKAWFSPKRDEDFVFIMTGTKMPPGRIFRALQNVARQKIPDGFTCGVIVMLDGPDYQYESEHEINIEDHGDFEGDLTVFVRYLCEGGGIPALKDRCTLIIPRSLRGGLANTVLAVRHICSNAISVMILVDLDDCLIGDNVLIEISKHYNAGAEVVVGGMLRLGKQGSGSYGRQKLQINLDDPRRNRGGNIWSHLRTFRRYLFTYISDVDLRDASGLYYNIAWDWAIMLPIVEMAWKKGVWISDEQLSYLYEPANLATSTSYIQLRTPNAKREDVIGEIVSKTPYFRRLPHVAVVGYANYCQLSSSDSNLANEVDQLARRLGYLLSKNKYQVISGGMQGVMDSCSRGAALAGNPALSILPGPSCMIESSSKFAKSIPTGLGFVRNGIVSCSDAVVVIGGGTGTLNEVTFAWAKRRLIILISGTGGQADRLIQSFKLNSHNVFALDHRLPLRFDLAKKYGLADSDRGIQIARSPEEALEILHKLLPFYRLEQVLLGEDSRTNSDI